MNSPIPGPIFVAHGGAVGALMRAHDWSTSPLGQPATWPQSLRIVVNLVLDSKFPMFIAWGPELGLLYNNAYVDMLENKHPAALGCRMQGVWYEIWDDLIPLIDRALQGEATYCENMPLLMMRKGYPEQTWFTFSYSPIRDDSGSIAGFYCACTETTAQILLQRERTEENARLHQLFAQAPGVMVVLRGPDHVFELANTAYQQLVGHRELIGLPVRLALPEVVDQGFISLLDQVYRSGEPYTGKSRPVRLQRQVGAAPEERFVDFVFQPIKTSDHRVTGIFIEGSDVTEAVWSMVALQESQQRLREGMVAARMVVWSWEYASGRVKLSDNAVQVFGSTWERSEQLGQYIHPDDIDSLCRTLTQAINSQGQFETSTRLIHADTGETIWLEIKGTVSPEADGSASCMRGIAMDVTQRVRAEEALRTANLRKDEFLAMLAHELRNPLAPISSAAHLLKLAAQHDPLVQRTSEVIARQVEHMTTLVDDLLDVSRVTRGLITLEKTTLNLQRLLALAVEQVRPLIEARQQTLILQPCSPEVWLHGDETRLVQVFANILNNACKYTAVGGQMELRADVGDEHILISVQDNGVGISAEMLPAVFDLFSQAERTPDRSQGGLGLGLALVKRIVELHDGNVIAHSEGLGQGSTFLVSLPRLIELPPVPGAADSASVPPPVPRALRVLIVDDNVDGADMLAMLLEAEGHRVGVAYSAAQALKLAETLQPQVLFLDIGLPDMDGYELARRLRTLPHLKPARVVALTGYGQPHHLERSRMAGFDDHLTKPVSVEAVLGLLAKVLTAAP